MRMLDLLRKGHSQAGLRMLFHNTTPLGRPSATWCFCHFEGDARAWRRAICGANERWGFTLPCKLACEGIWKHSASLACPSTPLQLHPCPSGNPWFPKWF